MKETLAYWIPADEPPAVPEGGMRRVLVAREKKSGGWHVFEAAYLNKYELDDMYSEAASTIVETGFHVSNEWDDEQRFESVDVQFWAPLPEGPPHHLTVELRS